MVNVMMRRFAGVVVVAGALSGGAQQAEALQYYDFTGEPHNVATLTETSLGSNTFNFREDYIWNTDPGTLEADGATLGQWANSAWEYSVYQNTGVRNTLDLEGQFSYVIYQFSIPLPAGRELDEVTVEASINRGIVARVRQNASSSFAGHDAVLVAGPDLEPALVNTIDPAQIDLSVPGFATFQLQFEQEAGNFGYVDFINITATTQEAIPEPASLGLMGIGAIALLRRRR
jgi:hypothetical protein